MQELEKRCKENDKNYNEAIRKKQEDYESRLKSTVKNMEQRYKQQYDELAKLTQGMQEEGRNRDRTYDQKCYHQHPLKAPYLSFVCVCLFHLLCFGNFFLIFS